MRSSSRGRPHASSREVLADAACELFFEQGYEATSITEITRRAGVSRASFFNYFTSKSQTLWFDFDERIEALAAALRDPGLGIGDALERLSPGRAPETLALAIVDARTMGLEAELRAGRAERQLRIADAIADRLVRDGADRVRAEITGAAYAGAVIAAVWRWADLGAGRHRLGDVIADALATARDVLR